MSVNATDSQLAVRESEARTRAMIDAALDAVVMINSSGEVLEFNPAAEAIFGYTRADVIGKEMVELIIPPSFREAHREGFARHLRTGESTILGRRLELSGLRADGTTFPVELAITRVRVGDDAAFAGYVRDISEQRVLEEQLRQSQKMEAIGSLAGGIAHDFNNILMVIRSCAALTLGRNPDEDVERNVVQIDRAAERAAHLTRQLLAFSRQQVLRPEESDINEIVTQTLNLVDRLIGENIVTTTSLDRYVESIVVDRGQLGQIILNLAVNARDAMPTGGTLSIRTANVVLDASYTAEHADVEPGPYVLLQITDSGIGMDETTRGRIFDPFFTTKDDGTGLGLATVYGVVKQSNGHIWVYSEPGHGTTFKLYFPAASASAPAPAPAPEIGSLAGSETILLAEDEAEVRSLIAKSLRLHGYTVIEACNGIEALELAGERESIDLLLTDVVMPGMNGRELFEQLSERHPDLPVLFTSGYPADTLSFVTASPRAASPTSRSRTSRASSPARFVKFSIEADYSTAASAELSVVRSGMTASAAPSSSLP